MIKALIPFVVLGLSFLANSPSAGHSAPKEETSCPGSYMTQAEFNLDFANCLSVPNSNLLSDDRISYFYHLYNYSPLNSYGSCGYVSFIQYLCYYDTFYNDSIVPEAYERNQGSASSFADARSISPGVLRQAYPGNPSDLYLFILDNLNSDYQMKLMYIVNEDLDRDPSEYSPSIGMWDYWRIVDTISAFDDTLFEYVRVQDFGNNAKPTDANVVSWFDSYVKSELDDGNPVMLHIAKYDANTNTYGSYHSVVAYYYDEDGIHANFGWGSGSTDVIISNAYQITEAGAIYFEDVAELHSDNYIVYDAKYCGCGAHTVHGYSDHYGFYSNSQHKAYCHCGDYVLKPHAIAPGSTFIRFGHLYGNCVDCGALVDLGSGNVIVQGMSGYMTSANGSYVLPSGVYVIVEEDMEAYLNGELVFYPSEGEGA